MALSLPTPVGHLLDKDTLALWRLDDVSASLSDETGVHTLVSVSGSPVYGAGKIGNARVFSPPNESYIQNPLSPLAAWQAMVLAGAWTFEQWMWMDPAHVNGSLISFEGGGGQPYGLLLNIGSGGQITYFPGATTLCAALPGHQFSTWEHVAVRATPLNATQSQIDTFFNGVKVASVASTLPVTLPTTPFLCLGSESAGFNTFKGRLDDTRVSRLSRTDAEIFDSYRRGAIGLGPATVGTLSKITDHATRAATALIEQYKDKPKVIGLLTAFVNQVQKSEDGLWPALSERNLQCASGAELDLLGAVVGEPRLGRSDVSYRTFIQAKILLNLSSGTIEELYAIFALLISVNGLACTMQVVEHYPKAFDLVLHGAAVPDAIAADFAKVLKSAKDAGARGYLEYGNTTPFFGFDGNGSGFDVGYFGGDL